MDYEKLIERLNNHLQSLAAYSDPELAHTLEDAATFLSTLQAEVKRLKSLLGEGGQDLWSKENQRADRLEAENEKLRADMDCIITGLDLQRQYTNHYQQLTDMGLEASNSLLVKLKKVKEDLKQTRKESVNRLRINSELIGKNSNLKNELEQVKHQLDSYRAYYDDMASKPNCNTCADKDCKYRPIPGDTVRANCPLWRGPQKED